MWKICAVLLCALLVVHAEHDQEADAEFIRLELSRSESNENDMFLVDDEETEEASHFKANIGKIIGESEVSREKTIALFQDDHHRVNDIDSHDFDSSRDEVDSEVASLSARGRSSETENEDSDDAENDDDDVVKDPDWKPPRAGRLGRHDNRGRYGSRSKYYKRQRSSKRRSTEKLTTRVSTTTRSSDDTELAEDDEDSRGPGSETSRSPSSARSPYRSRRSRTYSRQKRICRSRHCKPVPTRKPYYRKTTYSSRYNRLSTYAYTVNASARYQVRSSANWHHRGRSSSPMPPSRRTFMPIESIGGSTEPAVEVREANMPESNESNSASWWSWWS